MRRDLDESSLSELESEYELEMDNTEFEDESEFDGEVGDQEFDGETDYEGSSDYEGDYESDYESNEEFEYETSDSGNSEFAERLYELSQMEFESDSELDQELEATVDNMADHFSFSKLKKFGKGFLKSRLGKMALGAIPGAAALKGVSALLKGDLKGLAKSALSLHPGIAAAMPALNALGFEAGDPEANREAWENYVEVAQEAFENAAQNLNENAVDPMVAHEVAKNAFRKAVRTVSTRVAAGQAPHFRGARRPFRAGGMRVPPQQAIGTVSHRPRGRRRVVHLRPGEYLVVVRKRR